MGKVNKLEQKIDRISDDIGITHWTEEKRNDNGSPPTYFKKKVMVAHYGEIPINRAFNLLLNYLGLEISCGEKPAFRIIKKKKKIPRIN